MTWRGKSAPSARPLRPGATPRPAGPPRITTLTLNGFQILYPAHATPDSPSEYQFRVKHFADDAEFTVTVTIDPEAVDRVARLTRTQTDLGRELDSLADVITFGAAPGMLVYKWGLTSFGRGGIFIAGLRPGL